MIKKLFTPHYGQIVGMILLLIATGWQLLLSDPISKMIPDGKLYNIEEKLEYLWAYTGKIGHRVLDTSGININDDYNDFNVRWAELNRENTTLKKQASIFNAIRLFLYVTGSGLFIYGKHLELKTRFSSK
jgi:hypothetical protein